MTRADELKLKILTFKSEHDKENSFLLNCHDGTAFTGIAKSVIYEVV